MNTSNQKIIIYQVLPRLFDNPNDACVPGGGIAVNGSGKMNDMTVEALEAISELGCTHVWYTGIIEHATGTVFESSYHIPSDHAALVKGVAGSPYAIKDYYDVAPEIAEDIDRRSEEFRHLVERTHRVGLKVIIDFVPNHVSRQYFSDNKPEYVKDFGQQDDTTVAFAPDNNFYYLPMQTLKLDFGHQQAHMPYTEFPAKVTGNDVFHAMPTANDWFETVKLNYGIDYRDGSKHFDPIPDTWKKMADVLDYWTALGVDGFRCDMAGMVPIEFWSWVIRHMHSHRPDILFIGELYEPERYQDFLDAGFDYLYDKVGLYDRLIQILRGEASADSITQVWQSQTDAMRGRLLHFMENHDEQRLASDFVCGDGAKAFPAVAVSALIDRSPMMIYFGQELGERGMDEEGYSGLDGRTTIYDYWSLDSMRRWIGKERRYDGEDLSAAQKALRSSYQRLLTIARDHPIFDTGYFFDLMYANRTEVVDPRTDYIFLRARLHEVALVAVNFSDRERVYTVRIPRHAFETLDVREERAVEVTELMSDRCGVAMLSSAIPFEVTVPAYGCSVYLCKTQNEAAKPDFEYN